MGICTFVFNQQCFVLLCFWPLTVLCCFTQVTFKDAARNLDHSGRVISAAHTPINVILRALPVCVSF